jgi:hypothetical protein
VLTRRHTPTVRERALHSLRRSAARKTGCHVQGTPSSLNRWGLPSPTSGARKALAQTRPRRKSNWDGEHPLSVQGVALSRDGAVCVPRRRPEPMRWSHICHDNQSAEATMAKHISDAATDAHQWYERRESQSRSNPGKPSSTITAADAAGILLRSSHRALVTQPSFRSFASIGSMTR